MVKTKVTAVSKYVFLIVASCLSIFPFFWMVISATNSSKDISMGKLTFGKEFISNFMKLNQQVDLARIIGNSFKVAIAATLLALLISSIAGYAFEIFKTRVTNAIFNTLLLAMMIPFVAIMIPLFRMMTKVGLLNSFIAVIIPAVATPFLIFFFRQNTQAFPKELIDAARVDGLNELQIFLRVYLPSMKSTYAAAAIITFMSAWNNYLWPLIILQTNDKKTLPLVISSLSSAYQPDFGMIMIGIVIATIPMVIVFFAMQKHFVSGMVGSVK
ncbi:carbohydrate ABC transporter permease [Vagococcus sp. BWB3-3]|uniref:Carbohydrate ABC transporter permease n=1 Tax=Vagococcus allomyrinae TaxID=2794353 RepID=A0A940P9F8_9ENTE|nr:carbohydrate ABC transporter permease [Vagococcus allomyrinae]MBP1040899.1 carbohydrate ABC transporter permease [Vagococcus allomyrinae]